MGCETDFPNQTNELLLKSTIVQLNLNPNEPSPYVQRNRHGQSAGITQNIHNLWWGATWGGNATKTVVLLLIRNKTQGKKQAIKDDGRMQTRHLYYTCNFLHYLIALVANSCLGGIYNVIRLGQAISRSPAHQNWIHIMRIINIRFITPFDPAKKVPDILNILFWAWANPRRPFRLIQNATKIYLYSSFNKKLIAGTPIPKRS